jgi:peptide/nickel transport system substrate-binding protein
MTIVRRAIACSHAAAWAVLALAMISGTSVAQKSGGMLKIPHGDSPASMSIHEESTIVSEGPMMAVFNNLVMFDQHIPQNRLDTIVPDLAAEWSWSEDGTTLTLKLRQGVKWHDGKPFTAKDVKCTWDLLQAEEQKNSGSIRANPGIRTLRR